jgi:aldehyde dehydrogenase
MSATLEEDGIALVPNAAHRLRMTIPIRSRYENWIFGAYTPPVTGEYFSNPSPVTGQHLCDVARGTAGDIELALDAAHAAWPAWGSTSTAERAHILHAIADRIEANLEALAVIETIDNGKPIRETLAADLPLAIDRFRYVAGCLRAQGGSLSQLDNETVAYHYEEPLGVVAQLLPGTFPLVLAASKLAPALAAGNCIVLKPSERTPVSILALMELLADLLPPGVVNIVQGMGAEAGKPLAGSPRIAKLYFTGDASTGLAVMRAVSENLVPVMLELSGTSANLFFADVMDAEDGVLEKALEGFGMFALNQGEAGTCPSRAFIQESIYDAFMERATARVAAYRLGHPLELGTQVGAQSSLDALARIVSHIDRSRAEGATVLLGGGRLMQHGELAQGYYMAPTIIEGTNRMRVFQEQIGGPVVAVTAFTDADDALRLANDTPHGIGAGVWTRDINVAHRVGRRLRAERVWTNCYHAFPDQAALHGDTQTGIGHANHRNMLSDYQQTKDVLVSYSQKALGFF